MPTHSPRSSPRFPLQFSLDRLDTPIGELLIVADFDDNLRAANLRAIDWSDHEDRMRRLLQLQYGDQVHLEPINHSSHLTEAMRHYFTGNFAAIDALPVKTAGTPFQRDVWRALRGIPCGSTISYAQLAARIGRPSAIRAVGLANGSNPISIVVPCHRVIGATGSLTGYGGGIERKRWLLQHESRT